MIQRRKLKSGEVRYDVRLRRPDGTHYVKTFRTKKEADTYKATEMADRARGTWIDPKAGKVSFADWSAEWLKTWTMTWRVRTADKHQMAMRIHWVPRFGSQEVGSITPRQVQATVDELASRYQPSSVRSYYGTLRTCFLYAVERDVISRTPCRAIKLPKKSENEKRVIEPAELHALADAVGEKWRCFIYLGGVMGLRFGEIAALRVSDFDPDGRQLSITRTLTELNGELTMSPPKSRSSIRSLPVSGPMTAELVRHLEREGRSASADLIFVNVFGAPVRRSGFRSHVFLPAVERLGLVGLTFHGLRHSAATQWVAEGVDLRTVQAWLGHADPQLVLRLYAHASDSAGISAAEMVAQRFWK